MHRCMHLVHRNAHILHCESLALPHGRACRVLHVVRQPQKCALASSNSLPRLRTYLWPRIERFPFSWFAGLLVSWCLLVSWFAGLLVSWCLLVCWFAGLLAGSGRLMGVLYKSICARWFAQSLQSRSVITAKVQNRLPSRQWFRGEHIVRQLCFVRYADVCGMWSPWERTDFNGKAKGLDSFAQFRYCFHDASFVCWVAALCLVAWLYILRSFDLSTLKFHILSKKDFCCLIAQ